MSSPWAEKQTTPRLQGTAGCEHSKCWEGVGHWPWSEQKTALVVLTSNSITTAHFLETRCPPGRTPPLPGFRELSQQTDLAADPYCLPTQRPSLSPSPQHISRPANRQTVLEGWTGVTVYL